MNRAQKVAWFSIVVFTIVFLFTAAKTYLIVTEHGWQGAELSLGYLGFCCIAALGPLIFRKDKTQTVQSDERDYLFDLRAALAGFFGSYCFLGIVSMTILLSYGFSGVVPVIWIILLIIGSYISAELARSIATLVQYGWKKQKGGNE